MFFLKIIHAYCSFTSMCQRDRDRNGFPLTHGSSVLNSGYRQVCKQVVYQLSHITILYIHIFLLNNVYIFMSSYIKKIC